MFQQQTNNLFRRCIDYELEHEYSGRTEIIESVKKCMKHIKRIFKRNLFYRQTEK